MLLFVAAAESSCARDIHMLEGKRFLSPFLDAFKNVFLVGIKRGSVQLRSVLFLFTRSG